MTVTNELIDSLLADYRHPEDLIGENGLLKLLTKKLVERALQAEMAEHLGHAKNDTVANPAGNTSNGKSKKVTVHRPSRSKASLAMKMHVLRHQRRRVEPCEPCAHGLTHVGKAGLTLHRAGLDRRHRGLPKPHAAP